MAFDIQKMGLSLFLNSLPELFRSYFPDSLGDGSSNLTYFCVLWLLLLIFCFQVGIPSAPTTWENKHTPKHQGRAKRRRKGGTLQGSRYNHREEEKRRLISILKSPLGQHHDNSRIRQLLCADPSCEVCNNATVEINRLLYSEDPEDSTPSVSPLASTAPVTEPWFAQPPGFSAVPPGDLIPPPSLSQLIPQPPSTLSPNPVTLLGNFLSPSPPGQTLLPEPSPPLEFKFPLHHSPPQHKNSFSLTVTQCGFHQEFSALHSKKTSFGGDSEAKFIDPSHLLLLSPHGHDLGQQYSYPKTWEDHLEEKYLQLFWGLPSLHSESLSSPVHVLDDYSTIFTFNSISNASPVKESLLRPYFVPPTLPEVQLQPLPQTLPQSQPLPRTQIQPQAHLQSPLPIPPSDPVPQTKACGVHFYGPQNASKYLTSFELQRLEWNVLQKQLESLWGLPSVVQRSQEEFYSSAPTIPIRQPSKAHVSISIESVEFSLSSELRYKFEHHLRKRLIQHRWGLPRRIHESLTLMRPQCYCSDKCESKSCYGLFWLSTYKSQSSKNLYMSWSQPESIYKRNSEMFQVEEDKEEEEYEEEEDNEENDLKDHPLSDSKSLPDGDMGNDSRKNLDSYMMGLSGENTMVSGQSVNQKQLESALTVHLSKKFEEINEGQLPETVHSSWHASKKTLSVESHTDIKERNLPPSVGGDYYLNTSQELSFLESNTQEMLEAHITKFRMRILWGLPPKVRESIEAFQDTLSCPLFDPNSSSSTNLISEVNSKSRASPPLRGSFESLHEDKVEGENSATIPTLPLPATLPVDKKGQGTWRQSPSDSSQGLSEEVSQIDGARQTLPVTNNIIDKTNQTHSKIANIHPSKLAARQAGTGHEPEHKSVNSSVRAEMTQGKNMEEKSEPTSIPNVPKEIFMAEGLDALQSKTSNILAASKLGTTQRINVNENNGETTVTTKSPPAKTSPLHDPNPLPFKEQLIAKLSKLENRKHSQAQGQPTNMTQDSDSLASNASLTHAQRVSGVDLGASQVLHVHSENRGVSVEQRQEPWVPKHVLTLCRDKNYPLAVKKVSPTALTSEELGGGDAGVGVTQRKRKRLPTQGVASEEMLGSKSPQTLAQKGQSPPESLFINRMKSFFQWLHPGAKCKKLENSQEKGSPISSAQCRGLVRSRAAFTGLMETRKVMSDTGKFLEEKAGRRHAIDTACPQEPLSSTAKLGRAQQRAAARAWAAPVQGHPFKSGAPSCKVTNTKSCCQAAVFAGQSSACSRHTSNEGRHPQKVVALKTGNYVKSTPNLRPTRRLCPIQAAPAGLRLPSGPPAALSAAEGTVSRDQSLHRKFRQKIPL